MSCSVSGFRVSLNPKLGEDEVLTGYDSVLCSPNCDHSGRAGFSPAPVSPDSGL